MLIDYISAGLMQQIIIINITLARLYNIIFCILYYAFPQQ